MIQHALHDRRGLVMIEAHLEILDHHAAKRFERRTDLRIVLGQFDFEASRIAPVKRIQLVPAERAQPREERGLATERAELADGLADRRLRDVAGGVAIEAETHERKAIQDGIRRIEELLECGLVAAQYPPHELKVGLHGAQKEARMPNVARRSNFG